MVQFLSIIFFSWISSIFVGFFKSSLFFVSLCILCKLLLYLLFLMGCEQNKNILVTVINVEKEEEKDEKKEEDVQYTVVIMLIFISTSIKLLCYFYTYIHLFHCKIL